MNTYQRLPLPGRLFKQLCLACLLPLMLALYGCASRPSLAATASPSERLAFVTAWADKILAEQQDSDAAGVAIIVVKDGKVVLKRTKGMADRVNRIAIDDRSLFAIASLTKPITAIAVMQLVESGKLRLDDKVGTWLAQLPPAWQQVTIGQLLSHQSGIADATTGTISDIRALDGVDNTQFLARQMGAGALAFAPGSNAVYNNVNYILLAEVIARASGQAWGDYLRQHIFAPTGMQDTIVRGAALPANLALNDGITRKTFGMDWATEGATGIYSSLTDLARLVDSLLGGKLVSMDNLRSMTQSRSAHQLSGGYYGYGFFVRHDAPPMTLFTHTGNLDAYRSLLRINYAKGIYYIVLCNGGTRGWKVASNLVAVTQLAYDHDDEGVPTMQRDLGIGTGAALP